MSATRTKFRIGPAGWSYEDWYGPVYPQPRPRGFQPLAFIGQYYNAVEVNTSFYRTPSPRMTARWPALVPADFRFTFKLTQDFTHHRRAFPSAAEIAAFKDGLEPVQAAGQLGPLLMQFPWSFRYEAQAVDWLQRLADAFAEYERFVEVRHTSWAEPAALAALRAAGGYVNIDQPTLRDCLGPTDHVFGDSGYVRLHGRNARAWFASDQPIFERYNYLYDEKELRAWLVRLEKMAAEAQQVYVIANNHYRGQGPVNALELRALVEGGKVEVPPTLLKAFPRLERITASPPPRGLFGQPL
jgi:uncharacterized protein YecE (DUF72 family)